jgi:hypothetical protein
MQRTPGVLLCGALVLALVAPAAASTFRQISQEELVAGAAAVVQGRVVEVSSFWNREGTAIMTEAVLEIEETLLGPDRSHVRLVTFGGEVNGYVIEAHGFPTFAKGQRLLLFLEPARTKEEGAHRVLGYRQGEFEIRRDRQGREIAIATWEADHVRILKADGTPARAPRSVPLDGFKRQIRETAERVGRPDVRPQVR